MTCLQLPSTPGSGSATVVLTNGLLTYQGGMHLSKYGCIDWLPGMCYYIQTHLQIPNNALWTMHPYAALTHELCSQGTGGVDGASPTSHAGLWRLGPCIRSLRRMEMASLALLT